MKTLVDDAGRVVIPASLRAAVGLEPTRRPFRSTISGPGMVRPPRRAAVSPFSLDRAVLPRLRCSRRTGEPAIPSRC